MSTITAASLHGERPTISPDPTQDTIQVPIGPETRARQAGNLSFSGKDARRIQMERHTADLARQAASRFTVDGYTLQLAIGRTGGVDNAGWELHPPSGPTWYLRDRDAAVAAIPRHRKWIFKGSP